MNPRRHNVGGRGSGRAAPPRNPRLGRSLALSLLLLLLCVICPSASAQDAPPPPFMKDVGIDQKLDQQVPLDLVFRDESGKDVRLGQLVRDRPVILMPVYYECPMLCTMSLNDLTKVLKVMQYDVGDQFDVVTVSFDPREGPELAREKKANYVEQYGRPGATKGWHFLTGDAEPIKRLTDAVGFRYTWDEPTKQFAHASGFMILTPQGKLARYFFGHDYSATALRLSLVEASQGRIGTVTDALILYCFHYDPAKGKYSLAIINILRVLGMLTVLLVGGFIVRSVMHERRAAARSTVLGTGVPAQHDTRSGTPGTISGAQALAASRDPSPQTAQDDDPVEQARE
jgi:protein SCO1/2